jgi:hypothetical protein
MSLLEFLCIFYTEHGSKFRPLIIECAQQRQDSKFQTELMSGHKSHSGLYTKTYWVTDRQS